MVPQTLSLRERQRQNTRAEIVRVAFSLFVRDGYESVSVEAIAGAAGVSRATFFNYFPQKDLILNELAAVRAERFRNALVDFSLNKQNFTLDGLLDLVLNICAENARLSLMSKKLLIEVAFRQMIRGTLLKARDQAIAALTEILGAIPGKANPKLAADTLFSVFFSTMLEWLMREDVPEEWLVDVMRQRLHFLFEGMR